MGRIFNHCILAAALAGLAGPAAAEVLSIAPDGEVARYEGPTAFLMEGAVPIAPQVAPPAIVQPATVEEALVAAAAYYTVPESLVRAVAWRESRGRPTGLSPKGAIGVMQLMPATARELGVDPYDVTQNVYGGVAYLARMLVRYQGDVSLALAAYNAGPAAVDRYGGVPPYAETRAYVAAILARLS